MLAIRGARCSWKAAGNNRADTGAVLGRDIPQHVPGQRHGHPLGPGFTVTIGRVSFMAMAYSWLIRWTAATPTDLKA